MIAKQVVYQAYITTKPKPQSKSKGKKGPIMAENTLKSIYIIQELLDNKEESKLEHIFITIIVQLILEELQLKVLKIRDSIILNSNITIYIVNNYIYLINFYPI